MGCGIQTEGSGRGGNPVSDHFDALQEEVARKSHELRLTNDSVAAFRAELDQERTVVEQYRRQVELLEKQLRDVSYRQQQAEGERALADWHMRSAEAQVGRWSRGCTPPTDRRSWHHASLE